MKRFNVTGLCVPKKHYMVDISGKLEQIKEMIDRGDYFTINRARQYGKTTTLHELEKMLKDDYIVISISFEGIGDESFESPEKFCPMFLRQTARALEFTAATEEYRVEWLDKSVTNFEELSEHIVKMCKAKKIVLMIDEVDKTSNNRVFLHFLGMLRDKYLSRQMEKDNTFQSVILAGVYDIKNIKLKMMNEGAYTPATEENKIYNSPWNIAINFKVDMSFNANEIGTMLANYEDDHCTGMDITAIAEKIYEYTSGYPFLVSRICQCIDEELNKDWTSDGMRSIGDPHESPSKRTSRCGVQNAVTIILKEENTLFDDLFKNLENNKELYNLIYDILILGKQRMFTSDSPTVKLGMMYGIISESEQGVTVSNKIFEIRICNYFIAKDEENQSKRITGVLQYDVVKDGQFNMELCLRKFAQHYAEMFSESDIEFLERHGRLLFLSYLRPLINGQGFYHLESQFTDLRRMDVVVDFGREQFIIELKVWHGDKYKEEAYKQLLGYMDSKNADTGYMLTFDFRKSTDRHNKSANGQPFAEWIDFGAKRILDVVV